MLTSRIPSRTFLTASQVLRPTTSSSHTVHNQTREYPDFDAFGCDKALVDVVNAFGGGWGSEVLHSYGKKVGAKETAVHADLANKYGPVLRNFDRFGNRIDVIEYHPSYHHCMAQGINNQVPSFGWTNTRNGSMVVRSALALMAYQAEGGTSCPMTMTFASIPALMHAPPEVSSAWIPKLLSANYDSRDIPVSEKLGATMGMSMTEKQGGSDVRSNTTTATLLGTSGGVSQFSVSGHKWFTSAPMCDGFLSLAQTPEGISCFLIPRWLPDGTRNSGLKVMRLKEKLGDRSNASSELEYDGAWGVSVGPLGKGVRTILDMVVHTRLDCGLGSAGLMRQAVRMATHHVSHRNAFGGRIIDHRAMRNVLADIGLESEAALLMIFRVAKSFDDVKANPHDHSQKAFLRIATAVAKYWITKRAPGVVCEAMECHGGNGYAEEGGMPRLYRQAPLNSIWEGSGNVMCLDVLRALTKEPESCQAFLAELDTAAGMHPAVDRAVAALRSTLVALSKCTPVEASGWSRFLVEQMARCLQATLLAQSGHTAMTDLYCQTRLNPEGACNFGGASVGGPAVDFIIDRQAMH